MKSNVLFSLYTVESKFFFHVFDEHLKIILLAFLLFAGAFLIPFMTMLILEGIPLFLIELGMGQKMRLGSLGVWNTSKLNSVCDLFKIVSDLTLLIINYSTSMARWHWDIVLYSHVICGIVL